ncbi:MAG TPA: hypothetical protein VHA80_01585 [Solirubrobacterales bacterium]|nr:hypothetical protein [Solirubrobacterales bacterium]
MLMGDEGVRLTTLPPLPEHPSQTEATLVGGALDLGVRPALDRRDLLEGVAERQQDQGPPLVGLQHPESGDETGDLLGRLDQLSGTAALLRRLDPEVRLDPLGGDLLDHGAAFAAPAGDRPGAALHHDQHPTPGLLDAVALEVEEELHAGVAECVLGVLGPLGMEACMTAEARAVLAHQPLEETGVPFLPWSVVLSPGGHAAPPHAAGVPESGRSASRRQPGEVDSGRGSGSSPEKVSSSLGAPLTWPSSRRSYGTGLSDP